MATIKKTVSWKVFRCSRLSDGTFAIESCKTKAGEKIQLFAERILSLVEETYHNQGGQAVERQLIDIFVDGLTNDKLKLKILRDQPGTLQGAIGIATNKQILRAGVQLSHNTRLNVTQHTGDTHTPMEVDHSRGQRFRYQNKFKRVNTANTQN